MKMEQKSYIWVLYCTVVKIYRRISAVLSLIILIDDHL